MIDVVKPISNNEALLVLGSLNVKEEDRYHSRSEIQPVQLVIDRSIVKLPFFNGWGESGVSSMARKSSNDEALYITTGADLIEIKLGQKDFIRKFEVPYLKDVHELTLIGSLLWIANTGYDEAVAFDIREYKVVKRIKLEQFRLRTAVTHETSFEHKGEYQEVDRFHCNQIFEGLDGKLYALVHHVSGKQVITRIAKKFIKKHGDGGVIDLETGYGVQLWLKAPHTVRIVNGQYWIFDSGNMRINVYDKEWYLKSQIPTMGWGRGADLSANMDLFYAGISEKRLRYREHNDLAVGNMIQVFWTKDGSCVEKIAVPDGIEQINNLYVIPRIMADALKCLC